MAFSYIYTPNRLIQTRKKFDERYGKKTGLANKPEFHEERFEELIEEIKKHENMAFFARWLTTKDQLLLVNRYNMIPDEAIKEKVLQIFEALGPEKYIRQLFNNYLRNWQDVLLKKYLRKFLSRKTLDFPPKIWLAIWEQEDVPQYIGLKIGHKPQDILVSLAGLGMEEEKLELAQECKYWAYAQGTADFFSTQSEDQLEKDFNLLNFIKLRKVIENYLTVMEPGSFHEKVMMFILKNFGAPTETNLKWKGISETAQEKFRLWYYRAELEGFFNVDHRTGKERFSFWEQYLNKIKNIRVEEVKLILIMDFGRYIVIEFGKPGNAAYIYRKDVFLDRFGSLDKAVKMSVSLLKDQRIAWRRILHSGAWQYKAAWLMQYILSEEV